MFQRQQFYERHHPRCVHHKLFHTWSIRHILQRKTVEWFIPHRLFCTYPNQLMRGWSVWWVFTLFIDVSLYLSFFLFFFIPPEPYFKIMILSFQGFVQPYLITLIVLKPVNRLLFQTYISFFWYPKTLVLSVLILPLNTREEKINLFFIFRMMSATFNKHVYNLT